MAGLIFVSASTVLPRLAEILNAPAWVISMTPMLTMMGMCLPALFTAHWIESMPRVMPVLLITGLFQRLPYLVAGLLLVYAGTSYPAVALWAAVLAPLVSGAAAGISITGWLELVAKTVPANRRASVFAIRHIISAATGLLAGGTIAWVLSTYPGTKGFGILHLVAFGFLALSYTAFVMIRESHDHSRESREENHTLSENLRLMPSLLRKDSTLSLYVAARVLANGVFIMMPYLAIHALRITGRPDAFLGTLVAAQMAGGIAGNALAGYLGDRKGGKLPMVIGVSLMIVVAAAAPFARSLPSLLAIYAFAGFALLTTNVGAMALRLEICPKDKRATYIAIMAFFNIPSMIVAASISATVWAATENFGILAGITATLLTASAVIAVLIPEPRTATT